MAGFREQATGRVRRDLWRGPALAMLVAWMLLQCVPSGLSRSYAGPQERSPAMMAYYSYPKRTIKPKIEVRKQKKSCDILRIEFPSALNVFGHEDIRVDYYVGRGPGRRPTVLMLPYAQWESLCFVKRKFHMD